MFNLAVRIYVCLLRMLGKSRKASTRIAVPGGDIPGDYRDAAAAEMNSARKLIRLTVTSLII